MSEYRGFYAVCILAVAGLLCAVGAEIRDDDTDEPAPAPSATTMRTAPQGIRTTYPDCRDTDERPCVAWAEDGSALVTEEGRRIPVIVATRDTTVRPRLITVK